METRPPVPVGAALGDREAEIVRVGQVEPVGEGAAGDLGAAFQEVPDQGPGRKLVVVLAAPSELVNQRTQRQGAVHHAASQHDVSPTPQRLGDREGAKIGVGGDHGRGPGGAAEHLAMILGRQLGQHAAHVVAGDHRDLGRQAQRSGLGPDHLGRGVRIQAAGVRDDLHPQPDDLLQVGRDVNVNERRRIAERRRIRHFAEIGRDHGFGHVVEDHVVGRHGARQVLLDAKRRIDPAATARTYPDDLLGHLALPVPIPSPMGRLSPCGLGCAAREREPFVASLRHLCALLGVPGKPM
jgi:hypothetical protein